MKLFFVPFALILILFQFPPFGGVSAGKTRRETSRQGLVDGAHLFGSSHSLSKHRGGESSRPKVAEAVPLYTGRSEKRERISRPFLEMENIERRTIRDRDPKRSI